MSAELGLVLIVLVGGFGLMLWWINRRIVAPTPLDSHEVVQTVIAVAQQQLAAEKQQIAQDMSAKQDSITRMMHELQQDLSERQREIRALEQDRNLKFGEISKSIQEHKLLTNELRGSTDELKRVLSSSQLRGSWGERQIEQIFESIGFLKNQHFLVQQIMGDGNVKPDFTVLLPGGKRLCIDAKFPFANLQLMAQTEDKLQKQQYDRAFASDVRDKVREIATRGYISEADGTCDYAVMFVPSESVFEFINRAHPEIVDEALTKKVLMASPYSLVAIVRTVNEAYRNFYYESSMRDIIKKVDVFLNDYRMFQGEFEKFGKDLTATMADYQKITTTRYRQMDMHIKQIHLARSGSKVLDGSVQMALDEPLLDT